MTAPEQEIRIRPATAADVPEILEIVQAADRGEGGWTTEAGLVRGQRADAAEVHGLLTDPAVRLLVAVDTEDRIRGCCYTRRGAEGAELGLFAVDPRAQGGGIGGRLLEQQAQNLSAAGVPRLILQVLQGRHELHAWYRRHGFEPTGRTLPFPVDPALLADPTLRMDEMVRPLHIP